MKHLTHILLLALAACSDVSLPNSPAPAPDTTERSAGPTTHTQSAGGSLAVAAAQRPSVDLDLAGRIDCGVVHRRQLPGHATVELVAPRIYGSRRRIQRFSRAYDDYDRWIRLDFQDFPRTSPGPYPGMTDIRLCSGQDCEEVPFETFHVTPTRGGQLDWYEDTYGRNILPPVGRSSRVQKVRIGYGPNGTRIDFRQYFAGRFRDAVSFRSNCHEALRPTAEFGVFVAWNGSGYRARKNPVLEVTMPGGERWAVLLKLYCPTLDC